MRLTHRAEDDLTGIWAYVAAERSEDAATRLSADLEKTCSKLLDFPNAGASRETLAAGLRVTFYRNCAIYYRSTTTDLLLIRVLHGARDVVAIAAGGGLS